MPRYQPPSPPRFDSYGELLCDAHACQNIVHPDAPFAICDHHVKVAIAFGIERGIHTLGDDYDHPAKPLDTSIKDRPGRVYFIRRGDMVKIGWSRQHQRRLTSLPHDALLLTIPGTTDDESRLHAMFADHLVPGMGREWFHDHAALRAFIADLRAGRAA